MARIRTIKPEFFTSEDIVSLSPLARLLYVALWCEADKEGRLEWKPMTFKLRYLPGDSVDINELCQGIVDQGLVVLYGGKYAHIPRFSQHQHINPRESESKLPDPSKNDACLTREPRVDDAQGGREGKGKEGKDITNPNGLVVASDAADLCPHKQIIGLYHEVLPMCPRIRDWTPARATQLRARWNEDKERQNLDYWKRFFEYVKRCDFLVGKAGKEPFFADLEWLTKSGNFTKVREGKYENKK